MVTIKYSIVIPIYNSHKFLKRLLETIPQRKDVEVIFIDDSEETKLSYIEDEVKEYNLNYKVLKNNRNMGVTYSRNKGYINSIGKFIVFLDSDDLFLDGALDRIDSQIERQDSDIYMFRVCDQYSHLVGLQNPVEKKYENEVEFLDSYGSGECLVVLKRHNGILPFLGMLKGHELCGLFLYLSKLNHGCALLSPEIVRMYYKDNDYSLSKSYNFKKRLKLIALGHYIIFVRLIRKGYYKASFPWFIKAIIRFLQSK